MEVGGRIGVARSLEEDAHADLRTETLDEPIVDTVMRDVRGIGRKLSIVLFPRGTSYNELRNWDLWGPLFFCLLLAILLSVAAPEGQTVLVFASVFVIVWAGAAVVTINAQLLGNNLSFFQSVCVLGYSIFPLCVAASLGLLWDNIIFRTVMVVASFVWSTGASVAFLRNLIEAGKKALSLYPVLLFFISLSWLVFIQ